MEIVRVILRENIISIPHVETEPKWRFKVKSKKIQKTSTYVRQLRVKIFLSLTYRCFYTAYPVSVILYDNIKH